MTKILESAAYKHILTVTDNTYTLSTCVSVGPGLDIYHNLTVDEIRQYKDLGMTVLEDRLIDMRKNYNNYKTNSWR